VRRRALGWLPWAAVGGAVVVVAVGLTVKATGGVLGVPLPPFVIRWEPWASVRWALVAAAALSICVALAPVLVQRVRPRVAFGVSLYGLALALGLAVNAARIGPAGWSKVFATGPHGSVEGYFEYLLGLPWLRSGIHYYVSHFAALFPYLTTHIKGNPPGPLVALHLLGISTPRGLAALCIGIGALSAPLAYDLGRVLGDERRGRVAGMLTAISPAMLLFGVTSLDYAFAALGLGIACLLVRRSTRALLAGSIVAAFASFFSWLLLAIPAWAAVVTLRRHGPGRAAALCLSVGAALVLWNGLLAIVWGYDPFSALSATASAYSHGIATHRPYAFWVVGSPTAWAVMLGLPVAWLAVKALVAGDETAVAIWGLIAFASILGFTKAETERIWLPFVPLACVAAAAALPVARLRVVLAALAFQAFAVELLFFTVW
jgi:hypothetical protein